MQQADDIFDDDEDDYEEEPSFAEGLYEHLAPLVKEFLIDHLGEALNNAPAQTFRDIEQLIEEDILLYAETIPDHLYRHRTIKDESEWDDAYSTFKQDATAMFPWPAGDERWYNRVEDDEEEDTEEVDLPEDAQKIVDAADKLLDGHKHFKGFMQGCCAVIIPGTKLYLQNNAAFDLAILSGEGYITVQNSINILAERLGEDLYTVVQDL